jgi:hypothetical protein
MPAHLYDCECRDYRGHVPARAPPLPHLRRKGLSARAHAGGARRAFSPTHGAGRTAGPHLRHRRRSSEARPDLYNAYRESMARLAATCPPDRTRDHFGAATSARPPARPPPQASQSPAPSLHAQPRRRLSQAPSLRRTARSITRSPGRRPLQATRSHWRSALPALTEMRPSRWRARTCALRPATARRMRRRSRTTGCPSSARHIPTPPHPTRPPTHPPTPSSPSRPKPAELPAAHARQWEGMPSVGLVPELTGAGAGQTPVQRP